MAALVRAMAVLETLASRRLCTQGRWRRRNQKGPARRRVSLIHFRDELLNSPLFSMLRTIRFTSPRLGEGGDAASPGEGHYSARVARAIMIIASCFA